ncbi:xanthine dehydrogenase accessory protein XdhC [Paracoccus xiamenensis]|uniref:xanthine dehydrogenase accessory protein XdhC n=1 Tax=Paracoccus xiamenensis TaxID=2714901 RepID=UPI00140CB44D|nr:xanthine dehydrogenase accessory protein XdhC [Paracoccus xiamenensis]NHF71985.1 xanthine dehydrogenase accessory protein XdhC [Paracoccus xiamenensis]
MLHRANLTEFLARPGPLIRLCIANVRGSSPREVGAEMFVRERGLHGTIGGGRLEHMAIETARRMLSGDEIATQLDVALGPEIGQCCGGRITVDLKRMTAGDIEQALDRAAADEAAWPEVYILGAGHVGRALADLFQHMPVRTILIDPRLEELSLNRAMVEARNSVLPELDISIAGPGSAFIVVTHDHGLDFLLAQAALARTDACYVGMIGSATKRAKFESWSRHQCDAQLAEHLVCPIGAGGTRDKRPAVIAAFVVAEVMARLTSAVADNSTNRTAWPLFAAE